MSELSRRTAADLRPSETQREAAEPPKHSVWSTIWETVRYALIAAAIIIPIRIFIAQPFVVSGNSMFPTFRNGEYLIVDELSKYIGEYRRGDVVIIRYPQDPSKYFIKRIIGLPGETVSIKNGSVTISGGKLTEPLNLSEPYVKNMKQDTIERTLGETEYFVMGDNRAQSSDSRYWGPVPARLMDGKALIRLFPFTRADWKPGSLESFGIDVPSTTEPITQ
jgi:signal peptidase I